MNLLNFIDCYQLNSDEQLFEMIDLHTRNKEKAVKQCIKFFKAYHETSGTYYFYTDSSNYLYYAGNEYKLNKSKDGAGSYFLILQNKNNYFYF